MTALAERRCEPCKSGVRPLDAEQSAALLAELDHDWQVVDGHHLSRVYRFQNFRTALDYVNAVGALAEEQGHHPDLALAWDASASRSGPTRSAA